MTPYYEHSGITIFHGDCQDIMPNLSKVDLVLTDPPYEVEAHTLQRRVKRSSGFLIEPIPFPPISKELREQAGGLMASLCKKWILTFCQIEAVPLWRKVYEENALVYKRTCIWVKPDGQPQLSGDRPGMGYETFLAMHGKGRSSWNGGGKTGVFIFNKQQQNAFKNPHPTMKPLKLITNLVNLFSNDQDIILDPFMGSSTTLRAAKDLGRKAIGIEIEEKYCEIAAKRLSQEVLDFAS